LLSGRYVKTRTIKGTSRSPDSIPGGHVRLDLSVHQLLQKLPIAIACVGSDGLRFFRCHLAKRAIMSSAARDSSLRRAPVACTPTTMQLCYQSDSCCNTPYEPGVPPLVAYVESGSVVDHLCPGYASAPRLGFWISNSAGYSRTVRLTCALRPTAAREYDSPWKRLPQRRSHSTDSWSPRTSPTERHATSNNCSNTSIPGIARGGSSRTWSDSELPDRNETGEPAPGKMHAQFLNELCVHC